MGNDAAVVKAGHRSERRVQPLADAILQAAVEDAPWCQETRYTATLRAWARAEAQAVLLTEYLEREGLHDAGGRLRPAEQALHRAETRAANLRNSLGLSPLSAARLGRDVAHTRAPDLLTIWAAMDAQAAADARGDDDGGAA